jgi:hypothetical protein
MKAEREGTNFEAQLAKDTLRRKEKEERTKPFFALVEGVQSSLALE